MEPVIQLQIHALRAALQRSLDSPTGDAGKQPSTNLPWSPGDRLAATVEATRADGRMLVRIGDFVFDAPRPPGVEVDQHLTLRFISGGDKPTFALEVAAEPGAVPAADVEISTSARQLDKVIRAVSNEATRSSGNIEEPVPLLAAPSGDAKELASSLQRSVSGSGMFYESHVRKWVEGDWPLNRLMHEPQARTAAPNQASKLAAPDAHTDGGVSASKNASADEHARSPTSTDRPTIAATTLPQIRNQLDFLDTGHLVWQGQLWPGQPMRLEIDEPPQSATPDEPQQWTSRVRVQMPSLGGVSAELVLTGATLRIDLRPDTTSAQDALTRNLAILQQAMQDAGLDLQRVQIANGK